MVNHDAREGPRAQKGDTKNHIKIKQDVVDGVEAAANTPAASPAKVPKLKISPAKPQQTIQSHGDEAQSSEQGIVPAVIAHQVVKRKAAKLTASIGDKGTKVKGEFSGKSPS